MKLGLAVDEVLATTRSVRKRLDTSRPVDRSLIEECLELAIQAPVGGNMSHWKWIVVDDRRKIERIAELYRASIAEITEGRATYRPPDMSGIPRHEQIGESVMHLVENLHEMPMIVMPLIRGRPEGTSPFELANLYGSIIQAAWSMFLALRERELGSAWATVSIRKERELAELLSFPHEKYTQIGMFPVAYTIGTDFRRARRKPLAEILSYNEMKR